MPQPFASDVLPASTGMPSLGHTVALEIGSRLSSALLYSRDDTIEALWVQSELTAAIRRGWRPPRPMARGGQHPTVEPAFQVPQGSPPSHLQLHSLPPCLTRFLYHREVDNLLSTALDADEEALAVARAALESSEAESEEESPDEQACSPDPPPCTHASAIQLAFALCLGDPCMPCSALTATQYRQLAACISSIARTRCIRFIQTCSSANARRAWPRCAKISSSCPALTPAAQLNSTQLDNSGMPFERSATQQCSSAGPEPAIRTDCTDSADIIFLLKRALQTCIADAHGSRSAPRRPDRSPGP